MTSVKPLTSSDPPVVTTMSVMQKSRVHDDDDDGLSYSSTEHDVSAAHDDVIPTHQQHVLSSSFRNDVNASFTGPSGEFDVLNLFCMCLLAL